MSETRNQATQETQPWYKRKSTKVGGAALAVVTTLGAGIGLGSSLNNSEAEPSQPKPTTSAPASPGETVKPAPSPETTAPDVDSEKVAADPNVYSEVKPAEIDSQAGRDELSTWAESRIHADEYDHLVDESFVDTMSYNSDKFADWMLNHQSHGRYQYEGHEGLWASVYDSQYVFQSELYSTERPAKYAAIVGEMPYVTHEDFKTKDATELARKLLRGPVETDLRAYKWYAELLMDSKTGEIDLEVLQDIHLMHQLYELDTEASHETMASTIEYIDQLYYEQGNEALEQAVAQDVDKRLKSDDPTGIVEAKVVRIGSVTLDSGASFSDENAPRQNFIQLWTTEQLDDGSKGTYLYDLALVNAPLNSAGTEGATQALILDKEFIEYAD